MGTEIFVVRKYENYGYKDDYHPAKRAFLSRDLVEEFLIKELETEYEGRDKGEKFFKAQISIKTSLYWKLDYHWGDYHYETDNISLIEFK